MGILIAAHTSVKIDNMMTELTLKWYGYNSHHQTPWRAEVSVLEESRQLQHSLMK